MYFAIYISDSEAQSYDYNNDSKFEDANIEDNNVDGSKDVKEIDFVFDLFPIIRKVLCIYINLLLDVCANYDIYMILIPLQNMMFYKDF